MPTNVEIFRAILLATLVVTALVGASGTVAGAESVGAEEFDQSAVDLSLTDVSDNQPLQTSNSSTCAFPLNVTDATGTNITLDERPERITTTNPSAAQTLWELDAQDRVVGVTQFASYLNGTSGKTDVSAEFGVSVEKVVATDPDLVLAPNASAGQVADLRAQNLTVYHFPAATDVDDIAEKTERTGRLVGNCGAAADVNKEMNETVDSVENRTADIDRPNVLYPLGGGYVAANNTFINEIMKIGGTTNVAASEGDGYPQLSDEVILQTDPSVILVTDPVLVTDPEASILNEEPYASTTAGAEENYIVMNTSYINQPAPRSVIESTEKIATAVEELEAQDKGEKTDNDSATCGFPLNVTDATGASVKIEERPDRITTTNPSAAQTLWEIGAQDRVVGVTQFAGYLNGTDNKTDVSAEFGVSIERVVATTPDLVLAPNASAGQVADLRAQNLTVYHFPAAADVSDIAEKTEQTGRLVGNCKEASEINKEMNESVENAKNRTADLSRPDTLYPLGGGYVAANGTFINEIMRIGGTNNVAASEGEGYPQLSDEVILQTNPELILVTEPEASILEQDPYASTKAGLENNYVVLSVNYLNQPAPRSVIESTNTLATAVEDLQQESRTDNDAESGDDGSSDTESDDRDEDSVDEDETVSDEGGNTTEENGTAIEENSTAIEENSTAIEENSTAIEENETEINLSESGNKSTPKPTDTADAEDKQTRESTNEGDESDTPITNSTTTADKETETEVPGFGILTALVAMLGVAIISRRQ